MTLHLYSFFRSSAAYRVRIALHLKGVSYDTVPVHLLHQGGEQFSAAFSGLNPQALVPVIVDEENHITQSLAILEYLEERFPTPSLLPSGLVDRAHVRAMALSIACDIHPLNNLRVLRRLKHALGVDEDRRQAWSRHWINLGFAALEQQLATSRRHGRFCFGETPTMADCCLIPQIYNARQVAVDMAQYPTLTAIEQACQSLEAFQLAQPSAQPDAM